MRGNKTDRNDARGLERFWTLPIVVIMRETPHLRMLFNPMMLADSEHNR
jgi:hypothetical protein